MEQLKSQDGHVDREERDVAMACWWPQRVGKLKSCFVLISETGSWYPYLGVTKARKKLLFLCCPGSELSMWFLLFHIQFQ